MTLRLEHINFSFSKSKRILNDVDLILEHGKIYSLIGANGSGKSTLFNLISGFYKPQSGNIFFKEQNISGHQPYVINLKGIGRTFQDLRIITKLSVKENIILAMKNNPTDIWYKALFHFNWISVWQKKVNEKVERILEQYHLKEIQNSLASEISYGQQKLLTIACCVSNDAELLLLDEPVAGINPIYRQQMIVILKRLKEEGKTILLIEHNTEFINEIADQVFFLANGNISKYASIEQMKQDPKVIESYM